MTAVAERPAPAASSAERVHAYARDAAGGRVVANRYVRLACERHLLDLGFRSRTAIHPSQVGIIHTVASPSEESLAEAQQVLDQFDRSRGGITLATLQRVRGRWLSLRWTVHDAGREATGFIEGARARSAAESVGTMARFTKMRGR